MPIVVAAILSVCFVVMGLQHRWLYWLAAVGVAGYFWVIMATVLGGTPQPPVRCDIADFSVDGHGHQVFFAAGRPCSVLEKFGVRLSRPEDWQVEVVVHDPNCLGLVLDDKTTWPPEMRLVRRVDESR